MANHLSSHLRNAAILVVSAAVALAAERCTAAATRPATRNVVNGGALGDVSTFVSRLGGDSMRPVFRVPVRVDPFDRYQEFSAQPAVASQAGVPTLPSDSAAREGGGRSLTAILVADERRVAVIDDAMVTVGDLLRDGARVSAIQPDRVFVVEKNGVWRTLILANKGQ